MYIKNPNLPTGEVSAVAISCEAIKAIDTLHLKGIKTYITEKNPILPEPVCSHTDLQLFHLFENRILIPNEHLYAGELNKNFNTEQIGEKLGKSYPYDVRLNCKIIGKNIFLNKKTIAKEILEYAESNELNIINVNQGYTGCSICVVNESAVITDDESIFTAAQNFLNDVLLISKGSIRLNGYNYGFIGGCCGKLGPNKLGLNGRIESHKDKNSIIDFLNKHNTEIIELTDEPLTDIGGIIPLMQK
ncbi:MAG: hypothetical protein IKB88_09280 [Clostridia bacterium]|nr:hypothetical protein [Clostridia bacterium]